MYSKERIDAAINLEVLDRVPVAPLIDHYAAAYSNIDYRSFMNDPSLRLDAILRVAKDLGPYDMTQVAESADPVLLKFGLPIKMEFARENQSEMPQFIESQSLTAGSYLEIEEQGFLKFMYRSVANPSESELARILSGLKAIRQLKRQRKIVESAGMEMAYGFMTPGPFFEYASLGRGFNNMAEDMHEIPVQIVSAGKIWTRGMTEFAIKASKYVGTPRIFIGLWRSAPTIISPSDFNRFVMSDLEYMVNSIVDAGIAPVIHCDSNWDRALPIFKRFPKRKCILQLDGFTNIRRAKEELGKHMALMGDVPANLLAFGTKDETIDYCRNLVKDIGEKGGFILSSGCSVPYNAKPENVLAIRESVEL